MNQNEKLVEANKEDSYSSILNKILIQSNNNDKLAVFVMFEYVKPEIIRSELFMEYLRIWDNDFYIFLIKKIKSYKKTNRLRRVKVIINKIFKVVYYIIVILGTIILCFMLSALSLLVIIKFMEFIVKLLNDNLESFCFFESPLN